MPDGALTIKLSAGLAFDDDGAETAETLLRNADDAMYHAKRRAPGDLLVYDPELRARSEHRRRVKRALRGVIERDELRLHYQPLVTPAAWRRGPGRPRRAGRDDRRARGPPSLGRSRRHGTRMPGEFIGIAEETGDIVRIGRWVVGTACRQLRAWQALPGKQGLTMMVNLSALELDQPRFGDDIRETVEASGITPNSLVFEITEHAVVPDSSRVRDVLDELQGCGVHLVIDDFGTGYSSLSYLRSLPIDGLKIAQPFVQSAVGRSSRRRPCSAPSSRSARRWERSSSPRASRPRRRRFEVLRSLGCHLGQGFILSPPIDAADTERLLQTLPRPWDAILEAARPSPRRKAACVRPSRNTSVQVEV